MKIIFKYIGKLYFNIIFRISIFSLSNRMIYFIDIDNTIANTWYSYLYSGYRSENKRLISLAVFINMRKLILRIISHHKSSKLFFISARSYKSYWITYKWLKSVNIPVNIFSIIIVGSVIEKVDFLSLVTKRKNKIVFIDDLSYNHENGMIKYYHRTIEKVKNLNVRYIGNECIKKIN